jgi:hypothetical protein
LSLTYVALGRRPIADVSPHELLAALRTVEVRASHESAGQNQNAPRSFGATVAPSLGHDRGYRNGRGVKLLPVSIATPCPPPMPENTIDAALRRMGYVQEK